MTSRFQVQIRDGKKKSAPVELEDKKARETVLAAMQKLIDKGDKRVIIFKASTGIGKSTYLLHELFLNNRQRQVVCSQVTIINTLSISQYVSTLQDMQMGVNVGYTTSQGRVDIPGPGIIYQTIKTTTTSYLAPMLFDGKGFPDVILCIDEAHTNQIQMQEQLAYVRNVVKTLPDALKPHIIVQSASIDEEEFGEYFETDFIIDVQGARHPVQELAIPDFGGKVNSRSISQAVAECVRLILDYKNVPVLAKPITDLRVDPTGSILVFVPSQSQMNKVEQDLQIANCPLPIVCLSGAAIEKDPELREKALSREQKVIVATNVVETGFTIESLSFVIDTLKHMMVYYNPANKAKTFRTAVIDKSMMQQRRGRVGRTRAGIYIALTDNACRDAVKATQPIPNMQMSDVKELVLEVGYKQFAALQFMDRPTPDQLHDALQFMMFMRYNPTEPGDYFWFLTARACKLPAPIKYFVIVGLELGARIYDLAILAAIMASSQDLLTREDKDKLRGKSNQVWEAFTLAQKIDPYELSPRLLENAQSVMQAFLEKHYDLFIGKKMSSKLIAEIAVRAFTQNLVIRKENSYNSLYCANVSVSDRSTPVIVTSGFMDFRQVEPELIIDLPITPKEAVDILAKFCTA